MKYILTRHAKDILGERAIPVEWLERTLNNPERIEPDRVDADLEHRLGRITEHGNRVLRVVLKKNVRPMWVVTVYFDRAMRSKL